MHTRPPPLPLQLLTTQAAKPLSSHSPPLCQSPPHPHPKPTPAGMDPDQVAGGVDVQHDDLVETTTYSDGGGGRDDSWARAFLRRGWDLTRKAAIAGVAATAAPVVALPIIILSVAGVALSVPFAAYLASLAATDRLMAALLSPSPAQLHYNCDPEESEQDFLDAPEAPGEEAPVFDYWSNEEEDAVMEENESLALPLSREPQLSEAQVPGLICDEDTAAAGEFCSQKSDHQSFISSNREEKAEGTSIEENEYITMEALPRGFDLIGSAAAVLPDEYSMVQTMTKPPVPAEESVQESSVSDNVENTEDAKRTTTEEMEMESSEEILSFSNYSTELTDLPGPMLGKEDIDVQREGESEASVPKPVQDSLVSDFWDKTEEVKTIEDLPPQEPSVPESSVQDEVGVEIVLEEVTINTNLVTGEAIDVQKDVIATALPETESPQPRDLVPQESEAIAATTYVEDIIRSTLTKDIVHDIERHGRVYVDDATDQVSSRGTPYVSASTDNRSVVGRPDIDNSNQTTGLGCTLTNKRFGKKEAPEDKRVKTEENKTMEEKMPTQSMAPQYIDVSKSPVLDDQRKSDLVASELQALTEAGIVENIRGSFVEEDIMKGIGVTNTEGVEHQTEEGAWRVTGAPLVMVGDVEDFISSSSTPYASAISDNRDSYTEEQLREQLCTLRTITGYRAAPSSTLDGELVGLYMFIGVEPPQSSRDASDLKEINAKLRFLKSIIGVE